jgi:endothelin-converting enzyme/putative endopeptidase
MQLPRASLSLLRPALALGLLAATSALAAPTESKPSTPTTSAKATTTAAAVLSTAPLPTGLDDGALDRSVNPCNDFYAFACGGWMKKTEIPADRSSTSRGFVAIVERNEQLMKDILERAAAGKIKGDDGKRLGDHYKTCMDERGLDGTLALLKKSAKSFAGIKDGKALARAVATLHNAGDDALFSASSAQDLKDSTLVVLDVAEGGLGLPDRDYYVVDDEKKAKVRARYQAHIEKMLVLAGDKADVAAKKRDLIFAFEKRLAEVTRTNVERRDVEKAFHRLERAGLKKAASSFDWDVYLAAIGLPKVDTINVEHPPYFEALNALVKDTTPETWAAYLQWVQLRGAVIALPKAMQDERFAYESEALTGAKEDRPRWKKCVALADAQLGHALGRVFVDEHFGADGKARTLSMVQSVEAAFTANLATLAWMDDATRAEAKAKADLMRNKIGYPDVWRDYGKYKTSSTSFYDNLVGGAAFETARNFAKVGKPVDKNEWYMSPPTVNAYNDPQMNEIVFPAGILQPPFFNKEAPDAVNFGAMGMVVGHEITHGFDDEGRKLDKTGNLRDWWSKDSGERFEKKSACVVKQFDESIALEDIHVNGKLTLGENTADLGGLKVSMAAMRAWLKEHPASATAAYTPEQLFFLGYAQSWCSKYRPENARLRAQTDPHSPPFLRVNNPLKNLGAFSDAFGCKKGDAMVREDRCEIW